MSTTQARRLEELERENARMRAALEEIAKQVPAKDMDEDYYEAADFEDGYDRCVFQARAALAGSGE
jgi:soluble cytochrome b562